MKRVFVVILDSVGVGQLPDAHLYGDEGSDTLGNISRYVRELPLPNLGALGIGNLTSIIGTPPAVPLGICCKMAERSPGKDTTTGHWELSGVVLPEPFEVYPEGFPEDIVAEFQRRIDRGILGNRPASGTQIIQDLGQEHVATGRPIVYTSADSVFQIACHEEVVPLETLYEWCRIARELFPEPTSLARVIARPFVDAPGSACPTAASGTAGSRSADSADQSGVDSGGVADDASSAGAGDSVGGAVYAYSEGLPVKYVRTANRRDFSVPPPRPTLLEYARDSGVTVTAIGKIQDIFAGRGIDRAIHTKDNGEGVEAVLREMREVPARPHLVMANLVDFDSLYGHRNDPVGYAQALMDFDGTVPSLIGGLGEDDILVITADHGCDPTTPSTDHSREYVPVLMVGNRLKSGLLLPDRASFADLGATVADVLGLDYGGDGTSFAEEITRG